MNEEFSEQIIARHFSRIDTAKRILSETVVAKTVVKNLILGESEQREGHRSRQALGQRETIDNTRASFTSPRYLKYIRIENVKNIHPLEQ